MHYEITVIVTGTETYAVEADSESEARDMVMDGEAKNLPARTDLQIDSIDHVEVID